MSRASSSTFRGDWYICSLHRGDLRRPSVDIGISLLACIACSGIHYRHDQSFHRLSIIRVVVEQHNSVPCHQGSRFRLGACNFIGQSTSDAYTYSVGTEIRACPVNSLRFMTPRFCSFVMLDQRFRTNHRTRLIAGSVGALTNQHRERGVPDADLLVLAQAGTMRTPALCRATSWLNKEAILWRVVCSDTEMERNLFSSTRSAGKITLQRSRNKDRRWMHEWGRACCSRLEHNPRSLFACVPLTAFEHVHRDWIRHHYHQILKPQHQGLSPVRLQSFVSGSGRQRGGEHGCNKRNPGGQGVELQSQQPPATISFSPLLPPIFGSAAHS